jgi:cytidyltransferase-like protein
LKDRSITIYADAVCDLFHFGHVEFFRRARALGDRLIVGILSDEHAASYKPAPILTHVERVQVVRGCRHVDLVLDFSPPLIPTCDFLDDIGANFCCHGDDMDHATLSRFYSDLMVANRLKTVSYTSEISTRQIIARIVQRAREGTLRNTLGAAGTPPIP